MQSSQIDNQSLKHPDTLHKFIQSLNTTEKRYFKLYASLHVKGEENDYMRLYDIIEKQKVYDEQIIKQQHAKEAFIKRLPQSKNHIFNMLLKSLAAYYSDNSVADTITNQLKYIQILYRKKFYSKCLEIIKKAKVMAHRFDYYDKLMELINYERIISGSTQNVINITYYKKIESETNDAIKKITNINQYKNLHALINNVVVNRGIARDEKDNRIIQNMMKHPLMKSEELALTKLSKTSYHFILFSYAYGLGNFRLLLKSVDALISLFEEDIEYAKEYALSYFKIIRHKAISHYMLGEIKETQMAIKKLKLATQLCTRGANKFLESDHTQFIISFELELMIYEEGKKYEYKKITSLINSFTQFKNELNEQNLLDYLYSFAIYFFKHNQYEEALLWSNKIINKTDKDIRQDIHCANRILNLMIHFDLGNHNLLEYIIPSTKRYISKKSKLYKVEETFLASFRLIINATNKQQKQKLFKNLGVSLKPLLRNIENDQIVRKLNLLQWVLFKAG